MSSSSDSEPVEGRKRRRIWLGLCRYDIVSRVALDKDYKFVGEDHSWHISWTDAPLSPEKILELRRLQAQPGTKCPPLQKMNHFPGMYEICRKDRLGRNLNRLKKIYPNDYDFFPPTWDLPSDMTELLEYARVNRNATFIIKPDSGCQGKGIFLVKNVKSLCPFAKCVSQLYVSHPFLIDGYKFDSRIYVLITSVDPLRVYLFEEGIARFATVKYQAPSAHNLDVTFMHLTNYSLNKYSDSYDPQVGGSKRKLTEVYEWMEDHNFDVAGLKRKINDIVVKTIICVAPTLRHNYRTSFSKRNKGCYCFDVLGFDILIDRSLTPMLLEVNHSPSLNVDLQVDQIVKYDLVADILDLLYVGNDAPNNRHHVIDMDMILTGRENFNEILKRPGTPHGIEINDALKDQFIHEESNMGGFRLIFREECPEHFARFMDKEYCEAILREQKSFLKKRADPFTPIDINNNKDYWSSTPQTTTFRRLPSGEIYAETKPVTPGVLDPETFLKFKSSIVGTKVAHTIKPLSIRSTQTSNNTSSTATGTNAAPTVEKHTSVSRHHSRIMNGDESYNASINTSSATFASQILTNPNLGLGPRARSTRSLQAQKALEILKRKNLEAEHSDGIMRRNANAPSPSTFDVNTVLLSQRNKSEFEFDNNNNSLNSLSKVKVNFSNWYVHPDTVLEPDTETEDEGEGLDDDVLNLDRSKLPSIFQTDDVQGNLEDPDGAGELDLESRGVKVNINVDVSKLPPKAFQKIRKKSPHSHNHNGNGKVLLENLNLDLDVGLGVGVDEEEAIHQHHYHAHSHSINVNPSGQSSSRSKRISNSDMVERWISQGTMRPMTQHQDQQKQQENHAPIPRNSFEPLSMNEFEEKQRRTNLAKRKEHIDEFGISETIRHFIDSNQPTRKYV